jgi:rubrerythrin
VCSECETAVFRTEFLIEAVNHRGELDPSADWQGRLHGRCLNCCLGKGPYQAVSDLLEEHIRSGKDDRQIRYVFIKEAKARHAARADTKLRDVKRVRSARFEDLWGEVMKSGVARREARAKTLEFLKAASLDIVNTFMTELPQFGERFIAIMQKYARAKEEEAGLAPGEQPSSRATEPRDVLDTGALAGTVTTRLDACTSVLKGSNTEYLQLLDRVGKNTSRYFMCRTPDCDAEGRGQYFSANDKWASTASHGGWQWCCPSCGSWYKPKMSSGRLQYHHV